MDNSEFLQKRITEFKERNPKKQFHINENSKLVKGPIYHKYCQLCAKNIEEIRDSNPRRRLTKFCSDKCKVEYDRREVLRQTLSADGIMWQTYNDGTYPKRKTMIAVYQRPGKNPIQVPVVGKKFGFLVVQI